MVDEDVTGVLDGRDTSEHVEGIKTKKKRRRRRKPRLTGLSKQRQTANARERLRMRSISDALLHLRYHLPPSVVPKDKRLSKIQTLRLAIRYISELWQVLQSTDGQVDIAAGSESLNHGFIKDTESLSPSSESSTSSCSGSVSEKQNCDSGFRSEMECESCEDAFYYTD